MQNLDPTPGLVPRMSERRKANKMSPAMQKLIFETGTGSIIKDKVTYQHFCPVMRQIIEALVKMLIKIKWVNDPDIS